MFHPIYDTKNNSFREIWRELKKSKKVLIPLHPNPDGDSLGSCSAMKYVLEKKGIKVTLISKDDVGRNLKYYDFVKEVTFGEDIETKNLDEFDLVVFLDYNYNLSEQFTEKIKSKKVINIDHHLTNSYYGILNYINSNSPSCCSILYNLFKKVGVRFDRELSLRLMIGICTDTSFFLHGDTKDSLKKALVLLKAGNLNYKNDLFNPIMGNFWELKKLHGILLSHMIKKEINGKTVAYSWATKKEYEKLGLGVSDLRAGIACMQDIKDLDLIFTLTEIDGEIKGSFRSKKFDTTIYSTVFGGGGHKPASGFVLETTNMKEAIEKILGTIKEKGFVESSESE